MSVDVAVRPAPRPTAPSRTRWAVPLVAVLLAGLWLVSLGDVRVEEMGGWGLLTALPATWYAAFAGTVLVYGAVLLSRRRVTHALAGCHLLLVLILFGTTSAVYEAPRYPWTPKHAGVVEYLLETWSVDRTIDIYHNFPGFFFAAAAVHEGTGIEVMTLAQWAQPFFALLTAASVYWAVGGLSASRRVRYGTALVTTLGDWIGQNYFAPQALAFPLAMVVIGGLLRSVPAGAEGLRWRWLADRIPAGEDPDRPRPSRFWTSRGGALALVAGFAAVVVTHPLSPFILLAQATLVVLLVRPARPWLLAVFVVVEAVWLAQAWPFLSTTYDLFEFGLANAQPPEAALVEPLPGYRTAMWAAPSLMAVVGLLTAWTVLAVAVRRKRADRVLLPVALASVPIAMVLAQPYGNEGIFRAYLFALPWMAFVVARHLLDARHRWTRGRRLLAVVSTVLVAALTLPANFAGELSHRVAPSDLAADVWFETQTARGSVLLPFVSSFPFRATADYPDHLPAAVAAVPGVVDVPGFSAAARDAATLVRFTEDACWAQTGTAPVYVALGPSAEDSLLLFGTMPLSTYAEYARLLETDRAFELVFRDGATSLFECRP